MCEEVRTARIAALNDDFRKAPGKGWVVTAGVFQLGPEFVARAVGLVGKFDAFGEGNDPLGEHDFGALELDGQCLYWKIDYYARDLGEGLPHPADVAATRRVLTLLLAEEY